MRSQGRGRGRRRRSSIRKQRFVSLRQQLATSVPPVPVLSNQQQQQLLAPQLDDEEQSPSSLFEPNYNVETTINSIFGSTTVESPESPSDSVSHGRDVGDDEASLARVALKGRERWVFCKEEGEGESITSACGGFIESCTSNLCLKLDYEKIVSAWSGKGPLYVEGEGHQVVPQLNQPCVYVEVGGCGMNNTASPSSCCSGLWSVPENSRDPKMEINNKSETREERVMRYREKRRSRLFSKRIRYEVRKINAEKRPRIKGRFVKSVEDEV